MTLPLTQFLTVWTILALNILSPGPNVLNTVATAMGSGRRAGIGSALGVGLGIGLWCLGMSLGMASLFVLVPFARVALTGIAVGLLTFFAFRYLRAGLHGLRDHRDGVPRARDGLGLIAAFRRSLLVNALNPKALTTWIAILAIFPVARATTGDIALLCAGACALSFLIHTGYALIFSSPRAMRFYLRWSWAVSGATGLFFLGFAGKIARNALAGPG